MRLLSVAFRTPLSHSLASEQTLRDLKHPRGTNVEVMRVDVAKWALRTSPKFTTGVKYQFLQDFWPDERSGNPNTFRLQYETIKSKFKFYNKTKKIHFWRTSLKFHPWVGLPFKIVNGGRINFLSSWSTIAGCSELISNLTLSQLSSLMSFFRSITRISILLEFP